MDKIKLPQNNDLKIAFETAKKNNAEIRVVGGVIRNILLGRVPQDFDLAINVAPEKSTEIFENAGYKVIPTGIEYGTITVVINDTVFEITSLRKDIETDGRRAVVSYTDNWQDDSIRRDFTINAIYADINGKLYDYHNGLDDLKNKKLVFVGDADTRINEDALRILRLFRFALDTGFSVDDEIYDVCKNNSGLIKNLSIERIAKEMILMLKNENFNLDVIFKMKQFGILQSIIPFAVKSELPLFNEKLLSSNDENAKIIAIADNDYSNATSICNVWKLSNKQTRAVQNTLKIFNDRTFVPQFLHKFLYYYEIGDVLSAGLLKGKTFYNNVVELSKTFEKQPFPINGDDLMELGVEKGVKLGSLLKAVESWWVDNNFKPQKNDCLLYAKQIEKI